MVIMDIKPDNFFGFNGFHMNLPKHTFHFLKKRFDGEESYIECIQASDYLKKSTDSLKLAIDNDVFGTSPDVSLLNELYDLSR